MRVSVKWLKELVDFDLTVEELDRKLNMLGIGIEAVERPAADIRQIVVGKILSIDPHPNADKLVVCRTDVGEGDPLQIICGAMNMGVGDKVPTALVGASLPEGLKIERRKVRGVESQGMMCSPQELGLGEDYEGLMILNPDIAVGENITTALGLDDAVFEIEVTPNRGDWAGMIGVAREIAALLETELRIPEVRMEESDPPASDLSSVTIEDLELCPRYIGRVLTDVRVGPSPLWLCQRLLAAGLRPINNVVDITNYVLFETGHPLHAFDYDKLAENRIVVRTARPGETLKTIDQEVHNLAAEMLIIADAHEPVAVGGVMGGSESEVGETTTKVFLESAWFDPKSIRRTARSLGMMTEASQRFQRGSDPEMTRYAIDRVAGLIQELAGARIAKGRLDEYPKPHKPIEIDLRYKRTDSLLGTTIPASTQEKILKNLGFVVTASDKDRCRTRVPSWRQDVTHEADLIEEIARLYGYENAAVSLPKIRQSETVYAPHESVLRDLRLFLTGLGLTELINMSFSSQEAVQRAGLDETYSNMVTLSNPLSENLATMRSSLIPGLLDTVSTNVRHGVTSLLAFEIGPVYRPIREQDLPDQHNHMAIVLTGLDAAKHWSRPQSALDFFDLKGFAEAVFAQFFRVDYSFQQTPLPPFQPGQSAQITANRQAVGSMGEVSRNVLDRYDIDQPVYLLELDLDPILEGLRPAAQFAPLDKFPPSLRDLAVVVDATVPAGDIRAAALEAGGKLLKRVDIFDIYTGDQVPRGKKSLALSLVFQSDDRTLTDKQTQKFCDKILKKLNAIFKAQLR